MTSFPFSSESRALALAKLTEKPLELTIGSSDYLRIVENCLKNSLIGERAEFRISPENSEFELLCKLNNIDYDKNCNYDEKVYFAKIEIELCKVTPNSVNESTSEKMRKNKEQKEIYEEVLNLKNEADSNFKSGNLEKAIEIYKEISILLSFEYNESKLDNEGKESLDDIKLKTFMNYSYCCFKNKDFENSINLSKFIIEELDDTNFKVYFRLGLVYFEDKKYRSAIEVFKIACELVDKESGEFKDTKKKINLCMREIKKRDFEERKRIQDAMFKRDDVPEEVEIVKSRADDFEKIELLGEGNFSVKKIY